MSIKMKKDSSGETLSYKFLVLGDSMVGKSSIIGRYINKTFNDNYLCTIGMDKRYKKLKINNKDVDIFITDTAGQERFRALTKMFYKGSDGIFIGFSLTDKKSFESINYWIQQIYENCDNESPLCLVLFGNKCDDKENIVVSSADIDKLKKQYNIPYFETSAKDGINVQSMFEYLTKLTIVKKGNLKNVGLSEKNSIDDIIINEKENQKMEVKKIKHKKKKSKFC